MKRVIVALLGAAAVGAAAQTAPPAPDPARIEQEIARARDEKWPMVVVQLATGQHVAFDPSNLKSLAGNHATLAGRSTAWAEASPTLTDDESIYFFLRFALAFNESCPQASYKETKPTDFEVTRVLSPPALLDPGPGVNRKEWVGSMATKFGMSGQAVAQVHVEGRKGAPKIKYDSLVVHLLNRGSTGLAPDMEAAFMESLVSANTKGGRKVVQGPSDSPAEGKVLEMKLRVEWTTSLAGSTSLVIAYVTTDRATGEVRARGFGRGSVGKKVEKDIRSLAEMI